MKHHQMDLYYYQAFLKYAHVAENGPAQGSHMFYTDLYRETMKHILVWNHWLHFDQEMIHI